MQLTSNCCKDFYQGFSVTAWAITYSWGSVCKQDTALKLLRVDLMALFVQFSPLKKIKWLVTMDTNTWLTKSLWKLLMDYLLTIQGLIKVENTVCLYGDPFWGRTLTHDRLLYNEVMSQVQVCVAFL